MLLYRSVKVVPDMTISIPFAGIALSHLSVPGIPYPKVFVPDIVYHCTVPGVTDVPSILTHIFTQCSLSSGNFVRGARGRLVCLGVVCPLVNSP